MQRWNLLEFSSHEFFILDKFVDFKIEKILKDLVDTFKVPKINVEVCVYLIFERAIRSECLIFSKLIKAKIMHHGYRRRFQSILIFFSLPTILSIFCDLLFKSEWMFSQWLKIDVRQISKRNRNQHMYFKNSWNKTCDRKLGESVSMVKPLYPVSS